MKKVLLFFAMALMSMAMFAGKIYFKPNYTFADAGARFAVYYFGHVTESAAFTDYLQLAENEDDVYEAEIPAGYPKFIVVRFSPYREEAISWSSTWGQTIDIELEEGKDMYTINSDDRNDEGKWKDGSWSVYAAPQKVITKDTMMYVAGNFTNWASGMEPLPVEFTFPADSALKFKQVRVITTYEGEGEEMVEVKRDTAWFGQVSADGQMSRDNSAWVLNGGNNVLLTTDAEGKYIFALEDDVFMVTFPELPEECVPNFGLIVNGTDYYAGAENKEEGQWEILNIDLVAGDMLQAMDTCSGAAWVPAFIDHMEYFGEDGKLLEDGKYSFYLKLNSGNDELYIVKEGVVECTPNFGLLVNGADYYEGEENIESNQWEIKNVTLAAGDMLQAMDTCSGAAWVPAFIDHMEYFGEDGKLLENGKYSFYLKLIPGGDELYIVKEDAEGLRDAVNSNANIRKALRDGQLYIIRDEKVYTAQGIEIR